MRRVETCLRETSAIEFKLQRGPKEEGSVRPLLGASAPAPAAVKA